MWLFCDECSHLREDEDEISKYLIDEGMKVSGSTDHRGRRGCCPDLGQLCKEVRSLWIDDELMRSDWLSIEGGGVDLTADKENKRCCSYEGKQRKNSRCCLRYVSSV